MENTFSDACPVTSGVPQGSVLGPKFFTLYLESLILELLEFCKETKVYAFADDLKLISSNADELQAAIRIVENWANSWSLEIQPAKSEHLSITATRSSTSSTKTFYLNQLPIPQRENVRDLGLILSKSLKWSKHVSTIAAKASITSFTILRAFQNSDIHTLLTLYKTHVRPQLEYETSIWNPNLIRDKTCVERVQKRFTKRLLQRNNIKFYSYSDRLEILGLDSLEARRVKLDIILMYKLVNNLIDVDYNQLFNDSFPPHTYNLRGHPNKLHLPKYSGSTIRHNFFSNRILNIWNKLPGDLINSTNLQIFKSKLQKLDISQITNIVF